VAEEEAYDYGEMIVVQHSDLTGPSALTPVLDARAGRRPYHVVRVDRGEELPSDRSRVRGVLVLGGYVSVLDASDVPWLAAEIEWVRQTIELGVPTFGICLGHQLIAHAMGGEVVRRPRPEIGFIPIDRTESGADDEVWAGWPSGMPVLVMHDDEVAGLPEGAEVMSGGTDGCTAFRLADGLCYGVQFHPETSAELFAQWAQRPENARRFDAAGVDAEALVLEAKQREPFVRAGGLALVGRWIDGVVGRDDPTPRRRRS
jgi:GMP synthase-like glutamine amidotransferase